MERDKRNYNRGSGGAAPGRSGDGGGNRGSRGGNYPHQKCGGGGRRRGWGPSSQQGQNQGQGRGAGAGAGGGRGGTSAWCCCWWPWWSPDKSSQTQFQPVPAQRVDEQALPDVQSFEISEKKLSLSLPESSEKGIVPIRRPDKGGTLGGSYVELNGQLPGFEGDEHVMFWFNAFQPPPSVSSSSFGTSPSSVSSSSFGTSPSSLPPSVSLSSSSASPSSSSDASLNERFQNALFFN